MTLYLLIILKTSCNLYETSEERLAVLPGARFQLFKCGASYTLATILQQKNQYSFSRSITEQNASIIMFVYFQKILARYVSLIPHISDAVVFPGLCDIWSTCDVSIQYKMRRNS